MPKWCGEAFRVACFLGVFFGGAVGIIALGHLFIRYVVKPTVPLRNIYTRQR